MGIVNVDHPLCKLSRKAVKACPGGDRASSGALSGPHALSHLESGHAIPFSPQDFCSRCEFVYCCHSTQIPRAGIRIKFTDTRCKNIHRPWSLEPGPWSRARTNSWIHVNLNYKINWTVIEILHTKTYGKHLHLKCTVSKMKAEDIQVLCPYLETKIVN